jgi:hypothetical protein
MYLHPTGTNEIPARAQLHTSVDRQTAAQMQNRSSMYTEQQSHFRMRAGYSTVGGICTEWHGWICLEDKGESATDGSGQSNILGGVGMRAKVSSRSQSHSIANLF